MQVWWCNQRRMWEIERAHGVVCSADESEDGGNITNRKLVGEVRTGDIIVHYRNSYVIAFSRAREDGRYFKQVPPLGGRDYYGPGWRFRTRYFDLSEGQRVLWKKFGEKLIPDRGKHHPINRLGRPQPGYLFRLDLRGLAVILSFVDGELPGWLDVHRQQQSVISNGTVEVPGFWEGALSKTTTNVYKRNPDARRLCLEHYGTSCVVCGLDLGERYGWAGEGVIHVHHLELISEPGESHKVDPINDLRPVCPNCHSVIHRKVPPYSIEEVQTFLDEGSDGKSKKPSTKNKRSKNKRTRMIARLAGKPRRGDSR